MYPPGHGPAPENRTDTLPVVKLLGERSTGTHLLQKVLQQHFDMELAPSSSGVTQEQTRHLPGRLVGRWSSRRASREALQDHNHFVELPRNGGWKHAAASTRFLECFAIPRKAIVICLLRHPADWLRSMHRNPFHGIGHIPRDFSAFIRSPWIAAARDELGERLIENPVKLYAAKAQSYSWLGENRDKMSLVTYENLILNPEETLRQTPVWPFRSGSKIDLPNQSARPFGRRPANLDEYRRRAAAVSYDTLSDSDRDFVLSELSGSILLDLYPPSSR